MIFVPTAIRLLRSDAQREERLGLVLAMGMAMFIGHFLYAPLNASAFDEFLHVRTAQDLLDTGRLFTPNSPCRSVRTTPGWRTSRPQSSR